MTPKKYVQEHKAIADDDALFLGFAIIMMPLMYPIWVMGKLFSRSQNDNH